jgi:hypothetical protein
MMVKDVVGDHLEIAGRSVGPALGGVIEHDVEQDADAGGVQGARAGSTQNRGCGA